MKEPINKKVVLSVLLGSIVFVIVVMSSVAYLIGKDVSNQDTSAAVETAGAFDDGDYSLKECAFNKGMVYCVPKYAFANQKSSLIVQYFPSGFRGGNPPQTPEWEITICKKKYTSTENFKEYTFRFPTKTCAITIKLLPGTELETVFTKEYKILNNIKNFKLSDPTYVKEIGVDYDATPIQGDINADLAKKGITESMIEDVVWEYKYTSDYCSADVASNFSTKTKYSGFIHPDAVGRCRVKLTAFVVTCSDCTTANRVVYTASSILSTKVLEEGIMPSPTSYWYPPTVTPTARPTPSVYPSTAALILDPKTTTVSMNSEMEVSIIAMPPSDNIAAMQIRLKVVGATIVQGSYKTGGGNLFTVGTCDEVGTPTTTDKVCIDITGSSPLYTSQKIGSFKILTNSTSPVLVDTDEGNAYYVDSVLIYSSSENLASYTVTP